MVSITSFLTTVLVVTGIASAKSIPKTAEQPVVTYLGTQGPILSSGAWTSKGIVYTSGTVPTFNGSIIAGGIEEQTVHIALYNEPHLHHSKMLISLHVPTRLTQSRHKSSRTSVQYLRKPVHLGTTS